MTMGWTLLGTFGQLVLGYLLFMLVAFSAGGLVSGNRFRPAQVKMLDLSMYALPGTCALSAVIVLCLHWVGGTASSYGWYVLPLIATTLYVAYFNALVRQARRGQ
ncbi:hypothetical protein [Rhodanobacter ginsengiterrae]|uniref:hypothetical protein n=1 Tax=Rhodanobacter ginsengiterrae TaxID=2008451 RepID=UPI003CFB27DF